MNKKSISEIDLLNYYAGYLSEVERSAVAEWIDSDEENRKTAEQIYYICFTCDTVNMMNHIDSDAALRKVKARINTNGRRRLWIKLQRVAAILFLPVLVATIYLLSVSQRQTNESFESFVEVRTTSGMISSVVLPDSTKVWLNSNSYLKYPTRFGAERNVELVGEAYFRVSKDAAHKFRVNTGAMQIEVMGTEFNVDAYDNPKRTIKTTLINGSVNMLYTDNQNTAHIVEMYPSQCAVFDSQNKTVSLKRVDTTGAASWKEGKIVFRKTPCADALRMVENRFNVEFVIRNPGCYEHSFTGMFADQRLDTILESFARSSNMRFKTIKQSGDAGISGREIIEVY